MNWKPVENYDGLYEVSDTGLVRSLWHGKKRILSPRNTGNGYLQVALCRDGKCKGMYVHRLVADAFIPNPLGLETVNHRDENKANNEASNLEWMSLADNNRYGTRDLRIALALRNRSDTSKPILQLDKLGNVLNRFPSTNEASRQTGIAKSNISMACNGKLKTAGGFSWKYA